MSPAVLLLGLFVGFLLGTVFGAWSKSGAATPLDHLPAVPRPPSPPSVVTAYRPSAAAIAEQLYVTGLQHGIGRKVAPTDYEAVVEAAGRELEMGVDVIAQIAGVAYVDGARELRAALSDHSGIDDGALDEAVAVALARKAREDVMRKEDDDADSRSAPVA